MKPRVQKSPIHSSREIATIRAVLSKSDRVLAVADAVAQPFEWHERDAGFIGLIQLIIEQQVSTASAEAIWRRFKAGVGRVTSKNVIKFDTETLRGFGLSRQKAQYVQAIAVAESSGAIDLKHLREFTDDEAIERLTALKGVGRWTAEVYLMFCEGRTDLFPAGDLALQEGFRWASRAVERPTPKELYARAERWRPHRGVAALLLWSYYRCVRAGDVPMPVSKKRKATERK
jgi:DNA-3-methyladenine glycosylase II